MQIVVAVGFDAQNNAVNLCTGRDSVAAENALHDAGMDGSIIIGSVYELPPGAAHVTLRYDPPVLTQSAPGS